MAPKTERIMPLRTVQQLRRIRSFYALGALLWAASAVWSGWRAPGSPQMWACALLLAVFSGLLIAASLFLRRLQVPETGRLAHHTAAQKTASPRHAHA
ncbi:hypothetical protein AB0K80_31615 [Streptomyces sp. NPDC052682]|uniref:hypothetical protein n=1 Tax=Streptomyces sp. NPDC052682 TaxID=3154954 RepID=UPI0034271093